MLLPLQDLTNLNRPINKVIMVDTDPKSVKYHVDNAIILDKWTGDIHDRILWDLIPFLLSKFVIVRPIKKLLPIKHPLHFCDANCNCLITKGVSLFILQPLHPVRLMMYVLC